MAKNLHARQVEKLTDVGRQHGSGKATARDVEEVLKECTASEMQDAADALGKDYGSWAAISRNART
jgi:hypothetical protein